MEGVKWWGLICEKESGRSETTTSNVRAAQVHLRPPVCESNALFRATQGVVPVTTWDFSVVLARAWGGGHRWWGTLRQILPCPSLQVLLKDYPNFLGCLNDWAMLPLSYETLRRVQYFATDPEFCHVRILPRSPFVAALAKWVAYAVELVCHRREWEYPPQPLPPTIIYAIEDTGGRIRMGNLRGGDCNDMDEGEVPLLDNMCVRKSASMGDSLLLSPEAAGPPHLHFGERRHRDSPRHLPPRPGSSLGFVGSPPMSPLEMRNPATRFSDV